MELTEVVNGLLGQIRQLTESESVVGKPMQVGDNTIIPVTKLTVGFGTGQGEGAGGSKGEQGRGRMGGVGGGIAMDPQGFLVVGKDGSTQLLALSAAKQGVLTKAIETVPQVVDKLVTAATTNKGTPALQGDTTPALVSEPETTK